MNAFLQSLRGLGPVRLIAMAAVAIGILAFFVYLMARMATPPMELLYGELDLADANQIVTRLQADRVPYELRRDGTEIWVPADQKLGLRVSLAEISLPGGGSVVGNEIFDRSDALGTTSFKQNIDRIRALEGELSRTIQSINRIKSARVHLVWPQREAFSRDTQDPSASIVLKTTGARLSKEQVVAIQNLVAAAVPRLSPSRISIVDDKGTLLARGFENDAAFAAETAEEQRLAQEARLTRAVEELLEPLVGRGKVRAIVSLEMDFNRVATTEEIFDPDGRVLRSTSSVSEQENSTDRQTPPTTVATNLPDTQLNDGGGQSSSSRTRTQENSNFDISKRTINQIKELGTIKRLTVAALVDGIYTGEGANRSYQARSEDELDKLATLIKPAVGFNERREDRIEVINMQFAEIEDQVFDDGDLIFGMKRDFVEKLASNLGLSIVAILFLLLVLKPLVSRAIESMGAQSEGASSLLTDQSGYAGPLSGMSEQPEELDELIDIEKVEGRVKASSIRKIGEIVEKHPEEALSIIRNWMYQEN